MCNDNDKKLSVKDITRNDFTIFRNCQDASDILGKERYQFIVDHYYEIEARVG